MMQRMRYFYGVAKVVTLEALTAIVVTRSWIKQIEPRFEDCQYGHLNVFRQRALDGRCDNYDG